MKLGFRWLVAVLLGLALRAGAQIDPYPRDLIQMGYNQPFEGISPLAAYAFYYHNQPNFIETNMTLRLAVAPVYLDSEVGFTSLLGPNTDLGAGLAGGGFADGYSEVREGTFIKDESFNGNGLELNTSLYHLFNPGDLIPLNFVLRGSAHYSEYERDNTAANFVLPPDRTTFNIRTGLRWGGIEPTLFPALAMELSIWYQGSFRTEYGPYGYYNDGSYDRAVNESSQLFWTRASLTYTLPESQQCFVGTLQAGTSIDADRFSAYRIGGVLPLVAEFPLSLPGYYYQEISAEQFVLLNANYVLPLDPGKRWNLNVDAATAWVNYLPGLGQPGNSLSGVGGGILYRSKSDRWKMVVDYGYGINAIRSGSQGANSLTVLLQIDLGKISGSPYHPLQPGLWRGWRGLFGG